MPAIVTLATTPVPLQNVAAPGYGAIDVRRYLGLGFREGVFVGTDFQVIQRTGGAAMAVDVRGGNALVQGDSTTDQGLYHAYQSSTLTGANELTIAAADPSNPRIDTVILAVQDTQHDGSGFNRAQVRVLTGTATAGATVNNRLGANALPSSALLLADILVPAAASTIPTANISDRRQLARQDHMVGDVKMTAGTATTQLGWTLQDGKAISRTVFSELYANHSNTHGAGDGSTTFNVADARGRTPIGAGTAGTGLTARALGAKLGAETVALSTAELPAHSHTGTTGNNGPLDHTHSGTTGGENSSLSHGHSFWGPAPGRSGGSGWGIDDFDIFEAGGTGYKVAITQNPAGIGDIWGTDAGGPGGHSHNFGTGNPSNTLVHTHPFTTANTGSGNAHQNMQPSIAFYMWVYHGLAQAI